MSTPETILPKKIYRDGEEYLVIEWNDGKRCTYEWKHLRNNCPCATCREERLEPPNPLRILKPEELVPLKPVSMTPVGRYAYKIVWSDGHDTGIFTLEQLRSLCEEEAPSAES